MPEVCSLGMRMGHKMELDGSTHMNDTAEDISELRFIATETHGKNLDTKCHRKY